MAVTEATYALLLAFLTAANNAEPAAAVRLPTFKDVLAILAPRTSYATDCDPDPSALTPEDETALLNKHNEFRSSVAAGKVDKLPKPADMNMLEWDKDLATKAQETAKACDPSKQEDDAAGDVTQNTGSATVKAGAAVSSKGMAILENWIGAKDKFDVAALEKYAKPPDADAERFSQLIWAKTARVGCGYLKFKSKSQPNDDPKELLVCNYSPGGRKNDQPVYQKGDPCTKCESDRKCDEANLLCKSGGIVVPDENRAVEEASSGLAVVGIVVAVIAVGVVVAGVVLMQGAGGGAAAAGAGAAGAAEAGGPEGALGGAEGALGGAEGAAQEGGAGDEGGEGAAQGGSKEANKPDGAEKAGSQEAIPKADG